MRIDAYVIDGIDVVGPFTIELEKGEVAKAQEWIKGVVSDPVMPVAAQTAATQDNVYNPWDE